MLPFVAVFLTSATFAAILNRQKKCIPRKLDSGPVFNASTDGGRKVNNTEEMEANLFAMHLLMPEDLLRREIRRMRAFDLTNDKHVAELAKKFQVPNSVMAYRLGMLVKI